MKRNCNLELRLVTPSAFSDYSSSYYNGQYESNTQMAYTNRDDEQQQLTIFYNGRVASCDVTELQARAIISLASRQMEEKSNMSSPGSVDLPDTPLGNSPLYSPTSGLSMKRSLQRFLQKRKNRSQATSPYPLNRRHHN